MPRRQQHHAFGRIVERYQSLICALAFSATGSVGQSEDLAQKTFVIAWQRLSGLREPMKLRSWLCGIARNRINTDLRQQGREPVHAAVSLEEATDLAAPEPLPLAQAITNEEVALLWREIGQLPESYREPLVLFYREHQSVARVAEALELSEDAVTQRLSRARRLLHDRMLVFVETALDRTNPGAQFAANVQAALPTLAVGSQAAAMASKGVALKGGSGLWPLVAWFAGPRLGVFGALGLSWASVRDAGGRDERRFAIRWNSILWISIGGLMSGFWAIEARRESSLGDQDQGPGRDFTLWCGYLMILGALLAIAFSKACSLCRPNAAVGSWAAPMPLRTIIFTLFGVYVASTAWIIWLAWVVGDRWTAAIFAAITAGLASWNLQKVRARTKAEAARLNAIFNGLLCAIILGVVNLRVDRWLAPIYDVSVGEMYRLLPMMIVHGLTVFLICWVGAILLLTQPDQAP